MAFSRKTLVAMGIEAEKIEQLIEMNAESNAYLKDRIAELEEEAKKASEYKKDAEKLTIVQKELDDLKKKVAAEAKEREGKDYDKLKKEYDDYKAEQERKAVRAEKEEAYKAILKDAGIPERHYAKILKYSDVDGVELDEKGKITTAKEILKSVKEEWADHIEVTQTKGAEVQNPPQNTGGKKSVDEILSIKDRAERRQAMRENPELFGLS